MTTAAACQRRCASTRRAATAAAETWQDHLAAWIGRRGLLAPPQPLCAHAHHEGTKDTKKNKGKCSAQRPETPGVVRNCLSSPLRTTIIPDLVFCARRAVQSVLLEHVAPSFRIRSKAEFRREGDRLADRQCAPRPRPGASPERGMDREFWRCGGPPPLRRASADGSARAGIEPMVPARKLGSLWLRPTAALGVSWPEPSQSPCSPERT